MALSRLDELNALSADPKLWEDAEKAQTLMKEKNRLEQRIEEVRSVETTLKDNIEMIELAEAEGDEGLVEESCNQIKVLAKDAKKLQLQSLLSGEADENDAYLEVNAGAGGTEACDWAGMLLRMYIRWSESHGYKVSYLDETEGDGAGIKSTTLKIEGPQAYGWLKHESGVHRLVRISPFDSNARRHTSFASVAVSPVVDENIDIEILEKDLRVDTFRASGAGGQHVNRTDSAVRMTHLPTGIVVECQDERSQHKNRSRAMSLLKAKLLASEREKRDAAQARTRKLQVGSGDRSERIRTYNFPQGRVTDHRINLTLYQLEQIIEGRLDDLIEPLMQEYQSELLAEEEA